MNDLARQKLCEIVVNYGRTICDEPQRCEALLRDLCPGQRSEIHVLMCALKERVAAELVGSKDGVPKEVLLSRLAERLERDLALSDDAARWSVESWGLALGVISHAELTPPRSSPGIPNGAFGCVPVGQGSQVAGPPTSPAPWPSGTAAQTGPAGGAQAPRSGVRAVWIVPAVLVALTFAGGTTAVVLANQQQQAAAERRQRAEDDARRQREHQLELQAAKAKADAAMEAAEELKKQLASLSGSDPSLVLSGSSPPVGMTEDPYTAAQRLIRLAENRRAISGRMMKQHREARTSLERAYGATSSLLDSAYEGYPHNEQVRAYDLMATEASTAADEARRLTLDASRRDLLVAYLEAQAETYREISRAMSHERDYGYLSAKHLWDAERKGINVRASGLRDRVRATFMP